MKLGGALVMQRFAQGSDDQGFARFVKRTAPRVGDDVGPGAPRVLLLGLAMGVPVATLMCWLIGGWIPATVVGLIGLGCVQGLWRGGAEIAGLVLGLLLALLAAQWLGSMVQAPLGGLTGTKGLLARLVATLICGLLVVLACWAIVSIVARRWLRRHPQLHSANHLVGGGLGVVQGVLLAMAVLWIPSALRPIAALRASSDREHALAEGLTSAQAEERVSPLARRVLALAADVEQSAIGPVASATNPLQDASALALAEDFLAVTRSEEAMDHLVQSAAWQDFMRLTSMQQARQLVDQDPALRPLLERSGVSMETVRALLESDTTLQILDTTTLASDLARLQQPLAEAIREARGQIK